MENKKYQHSRYKVSQLEVTRKSHPLIAIIYTTYPQKGVTFSVSCLEGAMILTRKRQFAASSTEQ